MPAFHCPLRRCLHHRRHRNRIHESAMKAQATTTSVEGGSGWVARSGSCTRRPGPHTLRTYPWAMFEVWAGSDRSARHLSQAAATTGGSRAHTIGPQAAVQQQRTTTAPQAGLPQPQRSVAAAATNGHGKHDPLTNSGQRCGTHRTGIDAAAHFSQSHHRQRAAFRPQAVGDTMRR